MTLTILERREIAYKEAEELVARAMKGDKTAVRLAEIKINEVEELDRNQDEYIKSEALLSKLSKAPEGATSYDIDDFIGTGNSQKRRLSIDSFVKSAVKGIRNYSHIVGATKTIAPQGDVDTIQVTAELAPPSEIGLERHNRLIQHLPTYKRLPRYRYLVQKQIEDSGGAEVVAPGDLKPTKKVGMEYVDNALHVVAVLSEPIDIFEKEDVDGLTNWISFQLAQSTFDKIEHEVFYGVPANGFYGLDTTSGVQQQEYVTDKLVTLMHGLGRLQAVRIIPEFVVLNSIDWLDILSTRNVSGNFDIGGPIDTTAQTIWGVPVITAPAVNPGEGWIIGQHSIQLGSNSDGLARVSWREIDDDFARNQMRCRVELRVSSDLIRPHGIVKTILKPTP